MRGSGGSKHNRYRTFAYPEDKKLRILDHQPRSAILVEFVATFYRFNGHVAPENGIARYFPTPLTTKTLLGLNERPNINRYQLISVLMASFLWNADSDYENNQCLYVAHLAGV